MHVRRLGLERGLSGAFEQGNARGNAARRHNVSQNGATKVPTLLRSRTVLAAHARVRELQHGLPSIRTHYMPQAT